MPAIAATYGVYIDLNDDGDFSDTDENVSAYLSASPGFTARSGMTRPYEHMARSSTMTLTLNNASRKFSPDHASALTGLGKGRAIKVTMTYAATTVTKYTGRITDIDPDVFINAARQCEITCEGYLAELMASGATVGVMENVSSSEALLELTNRARVYPVGFRGWFAGLEGYSNAGVSTLATTVDDFVVFDDGIQNFELLGDGWKTDTSPWKAIKQVVEAEYGKFFERPDGKLEFWDRHHIYRDLSSAVDGTITDANTQAMEYQWGRHVVNYVSVICRQRVIDNQISVLAEIDKRFRVRRAARREVMEVTLAFRNTAGAKVGAKDLIPPQPYIDYTAKFIRDGTDATRRIAVQMTPTSGGVKWRVTNHAGLPVRITTGVQRGTRVTDFGEVEQVITDAQSIATNRLQPAKLNLPVLEDPDVAMELAEHIVQTRKDPRGVVEWVRFIANANTTLMAHARDRAIGDRLSISEQQSGHSGEYFIIGIEHVFSGLIHVVKYILEPAPSRTGWLAGTAGYSNAGVSTYAVF